MRKGSILIGMLAVCGGAFGAVINDAQFIDAQWSTSSFGFQMPTIDGGVLDRTWAIRAGEGGSLPAISGGELSISMIDATNSSAQVSVAVGSTTLFSTATNYVMTTRMRVDQFADGTSASRNVLTDIRGFDRLNVAITADGLAVSDGSWTTVSTVPNVAGTYYTWQFEVSQVAGTGKGSVDIYRRELDTDPWDTLATGVLLQDWDLPDQFYLAELKIVADATQQTVFTNDYFQVGQAIPEPATLGLIGGAGLLLIAGRRFRM